MSKAAQKSPKSAEDRELEQFKTAIEEGRAAIGRGAVVPHERVRDWLIGLAQGKKVRRPKP